MNRIVHISLKVDDVEKTGNFYNAVTDMGTKHKRQKRAVVVTKEANRIGHQEVSASPRSPARRPRSGRQG